MGGAAGQAEGCGLRPGAGWALRHGSRALPRSAGSRSDVQDEAEFMRSLAGAGDPGPGRRFEEGGGLTWTSWPRFLGSTGQWTLTWELAIPPSASPSPVMVTAAAMLPPRTVLLTLLLAAASLGQRAQRPPRPLSPISTIQPKANFDAQQVQLGEVGGQELARLCRGQARAAPHSLCPHMARPQFAGTWLLVAVASSCRFLQEQGHRAEATALHLAPQGTAMIASTFQKLDGICWQVRQLYRDMGGPGRFQLQARGARGAIDVVVGETDYRSFAILYLERARRLSVKLYTRSLPVSDTALSVFEQRVQGANLTEDHILFFPKYGECLVSLSGLPCSLCVYPTCATSDLCLGPQVSVRLQTSSTSWMVSGQGWPAVPGGRAPQGSSPPECRLCAAEVSR
ncbi:complement component C8 gamma chain isoform X2 [Equus przewalskii]|uniref:Complement component C8 gamma chain isoform X2 n=1 Tax=Equus przewalskii TaxID=9798 RepID=A0ABM4MF28_EQUPR